jgi:hypothetical protein
LKKKIIPIKESENEIILKIKNLLQSNRSKLMNEIGNEIKNISNMMNMDVDESDGD